MRSDGAADLLGPTRNVSLHSTEKFVLAGRQNQHASRVRSQATKWPARTLASLSRL